MVVAAPPDAPAPAAAPPVQPEPMMNTPETARIAESARQSAAQPSPVAAKAPAIDSTVDRDRPAGGPPRSEIDPVIVELLRAISARVEFLEKRITEMNTPPRTTPTSAPTTPGSSE